MNARGAALSVAVSRNGRAILRDVGGVRKGFSSAAIARVGHADYITLVNGTPSGTEFVEALAQVARAACRAGAPR